MTNITLKHKLTQELVDVPCETWEAYLLIPELAAAYSVVKGNPGCIPCGVAPEIEDELVTEPEESKASKTASKNTSKESE